MLVRDRESTWGDGEVLARMNPCRWRSGDGISEFGVGEDGRLEREKGRGGGRWKGCCVQGTELNSAG